MLTRNWREGGWTFRERGCRRRGAWRLRKWSNHRRSSARCAIAGWDRQLYIRKGSLLWVLRRCRTSKLPKPLCYNRVVSGCGAAWLARLLGVQEVPGSNPGSPTKFLIELQTIARDKLGSLASRQHAQALGAASAKHPHSAVCLPYLVFPCANDSAASCAQALSRSESFRKRIYWGLCMATRAKLPDRGPPANLGSLDVDLSSALTEGPGAPDPLAVT
jgi:hypothetical protein